MNEKLAVPLCGGSKATIDVPTTISIPEDFNLTVLKARALLTGTPASCEPRSFVNHMYYLLGWTFGDLGKHFYDQSRLMVSLEIGLTRRHPENLQLGEYVAGTIRELGIHCSRGKNREPSENSPYGAFRWYAGSSGLFGWFHTACLGLSWSDRASWIPVKMPWMLAARQTKRLWFLRGVSDSDGDVHFKDKAVDITTSPNTDFVKALCDSLSIHNRVRLCDNWSQITIPADDAMRIGIFNPEVQSYRKIVLDALTNATTYQRHWPSWLQAKVEHMTRLGIGKREICERLLLEDNTYIKMYTLSRKERSGSISISRSPSIVNGSAEGGIRAIRWFRTPDPQNPPSPGL